MAFKRADRLAALQVPESQRSIHRGRDGTAAIGRHRNDVDLARMALERVQCLAGSQVPYPQRFVL